MIAPRTPARIAAEADAQRLPWEHAWVPADGVIDHAADLADDKRARRRPTDARVASLRGLRGGR